MEGNGGESNRGEGRGTRKEEGGRRRRRKESGVKPRVGRGGRRKERRRERVSRIGSIRDQQSGEEEKRREEEKEKEDGAEKNLVLQLSSKLIRALSERAEKGNKIIKIVLHREGWNSIERGEE